MRLPSKQHRSGRYRLPAPSFGERKGNLIKKEDAKKELDKCVLLCRNCHAEVHAGVTNLDEVLDVKVARMEISESSFVTTPKL